MLYCRNPQFSIIKEQMLYHLILVNVFFFLNLAATLDIILSWKARKSMSYHSQLRYILKFITAAAWVIILPVTYAYGLKNPSGFAQTMRNWFGNGPGSSSVFILAVVIYLCPNMLSVLFFLFPFIRRALERSDHRIFRFMMWWSQVCISKL